MFEPDEIPEFDRAALAIDDPFECRFTDPPRVLEAKIEEFFAPILGTAYRVRVIRPADGGTWEGQKVNKVWLDDVGLHVNCKCAEPEPKKPTLQPCNAESFVETVKKAVAKKLADVAHIQHAVASSGQDLDVVIEPFAWYTHHSAFPTLGFVVRSNRCPVPHYVVLDPYAVCYLTLGAGLDFKGGGPSKGEQIDAAVRAYVARMFTEVHLSYPKPKGS